MKYAVLISQDERLWTDATAEQRAAAHAARGAFDEAIRSRATLLAAEALTCASNATTLRHGVRGARPPATSCCGR